MEKMNVRKHWIDNLRRIPLVSWCVFWEKQKVKHINYLKST